MANKLLCGNCLEERQYHTISRDETIKVKGVPIEVRSQVAICAECGEELHHPEYDQSSLNHAYAIYREKMGFLTPSDITQLREKYGLSQRGFSKLLGWGEISIHRYEAGAMHDTAHNEVLVLLQMPENMKTILTRQRDLIDAREYEKVMARVDLLIQDVKKERLRDWALINTACSDEPNQFNGNKIFDFKKFTNMILYFSEAQKVAQRPLYKTKLWKMMYYADMSHFKNYGVSISGSEYAHLPHGPVPDEHEQLTSVLRSEKVIAYVEDDYGDIVDPQMTCPISAFDENEWISLKSVFSAFREYTSKQIREASHCEKGYVDTQSGERISYKYAMALSI